MSRIPNAGTNSPEVSMALPICQACAGRILLCKDCEAKLAGGRINEYDVEVSRTLHSLLGADADFIRAIDTEGAVIVIAEADEVGGIIGRGGANLRELTKRIGKPARVIGRDDLNGTTKALIAPARVKEINHVYGQRGPMIRVRVGREDRDRLRLPLEDMRKLISAVTETDVDITFD